MKLKLCEKKHWNDYTCNYCKAIIFAFSFLYFVLPYPLQQVVGDEFYLYSGHQSATFAYSVCFFIFILFVFQRLVSQVKKYENVSCKPPKKKYSIFVYWVNFAYLCYVVFNGLLLRASGASRGMLLEVISSHLFPGYGYILLLSCIIVIYLKEKFYLYFLVIICFVVDFVYQGKIFTMYAFMVVMFYIDDLRISINLRRLLMSGILGFSFLFLIFSVRSLANEGDVFVDIYSLFSEFMGVNATSGWGYSYYLSHQPSQLIAFDFALMDYYRTDVGHGLGLSPVAYFLGNFGPNQGYILSMITYLCIIFFVYTIGIRVLGKYALFVFLYNYVHLLRHGPNLFLSKSIMHVFFLIVIVLILYNNKINRKEVVRI